MPFVFKIGFFLALSTLCLSCPLRTLIRKKTRLVPLKVRKVYFSDPDKLSPLPLNGPPMSANNLTAAGYNTTKLDYPKLSAAITNGPTSAAAAALRNSQQPPHLQQHHPHHHGPHHQQQKPNNLLPRDQEPYNRHYTANKETSILDKAGNRAWEEGFRDYDDKAAYPEGAGRSLYLPGKDYYDESLYSQRKGIPPLSLHNNFGDGYYEEEERLYHPRVAMLKNTNIETELRGRVGEYSAAAAREGRRVHYQERGGVGGDYRRHQSPSPGPRDRGLHPGGHHRSRRPDGDEPWSEGYGYRSHHLPEDEVQYNA